MRVRVLRFRDQPGERTQQHGHPDSVLYALSSFKRRLTFPDGTVREREVQEGEVMWVPAQTHVGENTGRPGSGAADMDTPDDATTSTEANRSVLDRADTILAAFDSAHTDLSLLGIMARTGLPKTTVHRSVHKLVDLEWL